MSAYLLYDTKIELCRINDESALVDCADTGVTGEFMVAMAVTASHAYIVDNRQDGSAIIHCGIGSDGALTSCENTGVTGLVATYGLTVHGSHLYLTSYGEPKVLKCDIRHEDGALAACVDAGFPAAQADALEDLRIVNSTAYVLDYDLERVTKCAVADEGTFSDCQNAGPLDVSGPEGLTIRGNQLFVTDSDNDKVVRCLFGDGGTLTDCVDTGAEGLGYPTQIAFRDSAVFITNGNDAGGVTRCTVSADGLMSGCTSIRSEPGLLYSIILR